MTVPVWPFSWRRLLFPSLFRAFPAPGGKSCSLSPEQFIYSRKWISNSIFPCVKRPECAGSLLEIIGSAALCLVPKDSAVNKQKMTRPSEAEEGSSPQTAGPRQGRWRSPQSWLGLRNPQTQAFPGKMDKIALFLVVLKARPNRASLGANSWALTLSSKWDEMQKEWRVSWWGMVKCKNQGSTGGAGGRRAVPEFQRVEACSGPKVEELAALRPSQAPGSHGLGVDGTP